MGWGIGQYRVSMGIITMGSPGVGRDHMGGAVGTWTSENLSDNNNNSGHK